MTGETIEGDLEPAAIIMAAGKGTRMNSPLPKVLVEVAGKPMIDYVLDALAKAGARRSVVVVGHQADLVREHLHARPGVEFVTQEEQLGTGHAVMVCRETLKNHAGPIIVVAGDSPLMRAASIAGLLDQYEQDRPACLLGTAKKDDPAGLGRILRDEAGEFVGIVEEKDADETQRLIQEVNLSTYVFSPGDLFESLGEIQPNNSQGEYYVTDCPGLLRSKGKSVRAWPGLHPHEAFSVNQPRELAVVEELLRHEESENL
ncbi:MAG: NTP transferase domain-containing protein [Planctomycetales bacterium]